MRGKSCLSAVFPIIAVCIMWASAAKGEILSAHAELRFFPDPITFGCAGGIRPPFNGIVSSWCGLNDGNPRSDVDPTNPAQGSASATAGSKKITGDLHIAAPGLCEPDLNETLVLCYGYAQSEFMTGIEISGPSGDGFVQYVIKGSTLVPNAALRFEVVHSQPELSAYVDDVMWPDTSGPFAYESLLIPVRFGQVFDFGLKGYLWMSHEGTASFSFELHEIRVFDRDQRPLADAEILYPAPEPGSGVLILSGLGLVLLRFGNFWRA